MSNAPHASQNQPDKIHQVEIEGCFGSIFWTPPARLYALMPRADRDGILDYAGTDQITPHIVDLTRRVLTHVNNPLDVAHLDSTFSFESREFECEGFGKIVWMFGQGIWDAIPGDQRDVMLDIISVDLHEYFEERIILPITRHSIRKFRQ